MGSNAGRGDTNYNCKLTVLKRGEKAHLEDIQAQKRSRSTAFPHLATTHNPVQQLSFVSQLPVAGPASS